MIRNLLNKRNYQIRKLARMYDVKVIDHYENPRNVGSFDKKDNNVGTGIVGAPACIHEDTLIAVADGRRFVKISELYLDNKDVPVWSYNINTDIYEIKLARVIKQSEKKQMIKLTFDDNSFIICTPDHPFLTSTKEYISSGKLDKTTSIVPFKRSISSHESESVKLCDKFEYYHKIIRVDVLDGFYNCYDLQVEENNNFAVITNVSKNIQSGIILKNCGDVLKLQIKVEDGKIVDSCFKAFGCGSAIASSSYASELIKGKSTSQASEVSNKTIASDLKLPPVKLHCSMLAEDAIKAALDDYKNKNEK